MRDPGSNPLGDTYVKPGFLLLALSRYIGDPDVIMITGFVTLQWVLHKALRRQCVSQRLHHPSVGASLGSAPTMCKPTLPHTPLPSCFHARCRSSFLLHNRRSSSCSCVINVLNQSIICMCLCILKKNHYFYRFVESLQSHFILTMSYWSSGLSVCFPVMRDPGSNPQGGTYVKPDFSC
jgi:hypothetical protein